MLTKYLKHIQDNPGPSLMAKKLRLYQIRQTCNIRPGQDIGSTCLSYNQVLCFLLKNKQINNDV